SHQTRFVFQRRRSDRNVTRVEPCDLRGQDSTNLRVENLPGFGDRPAENDDLRVDRIDDRDQSPPDLTGRLPYRFPRLRLAFQTTGDDLFDRDIRRRRRRLTAARAVL